MVHSFFFTTQSEFEHQLRHKPCFIQSLQRLRPAFLPFMGIMNPHEIRSDDPWEISSLLGLIFRLLLEHLWKAMDGASGRQSKPKIEKSFDNVKDDSDRLCGLRDRATISVEQL